MKISIAMATFNGGQYLKAQLQSFVKQTRQPDELIITDDCSSDETEIIVREFEKNVPFKVEFYRNERRLGYSGNFNSALMKTTGDLVFLSDQDDVWFPDKIEHMVTVAENNQNALLVMNDAALTDGELNRVGLTKLEQIRSAGFSMDSFVMGCCCAVRRELLDFCLPMPAGFKGHDTWLVWFADGLNAKVVDETVLQYYRRHESNESQFIVNRTKRVTPFRVFIHSLRKLSRENSETQLATQLEQLRLFSDSVDDVQSIALDIYSNRLRKLENRFRQRIETIERRYVVRRKKFIPRVIGVGDLYFRGEYRDLSGLKSALKDIFG